MIINMGGAVDPPAPSKAAGKGSKKK